MINVRNFLEQGLSRKITISWHVSGVRVSVSDFEYGEVVNFVSPTIEDAMQKCIDNFDQSVKRKVFEKIEHLENKKKEIEKDFNSISSDICSLKLNFFKDSQKSEALDCLSNLGVK